jgi:hypothetical protein
LFTDALQLDASRRAVEDAAREKDLAEKKINRLEKAKLAEGKGEGISVPYNSSPGCTSPGEEEDAQPPAKKNNYQHALQPLFVDQGIAAECMLC